MPRNAPACPTNLDQQAERAGGGEARMAGPLTTAPALQNEPNTCHLPPEQEAAIELMLTGATETAIAEAVGVNRKTLYLWRTRNHGFQQRLELRRREVYRQAEDRFRGMLELALEQLEKQMRDPYTPTSFRAARAVVALAALGRAIAPPPSASPRVRPVLADPAGPDPNPGR